MPKILLVANTGWYLYNFRLPLARFLRDRGVDVVMVSPEDPYVARLQAEGFRWVELDLDRRSVNPLRELMVVGRLARIFRRERPDAVHHFTIKCVLYGTIAAKLAGVRAVVNALTGLGHVFMGTGWKARVLRPAVKWLYRNILTARRVRVVFQNPDDLQTFADSRLVVPDRTVLIRGSGVNLQRFAPRPGSPDGQPAPIVLFAARLNRDKGVHEFVEAARILKTRGVQATFQIAGNPDPGNPSTVKEADLEGWRREGAVDLLGHVDAVDDIIAPATVVTLPTHGARACCASCSRPRPWASPWSRPTSPAAARPSCTGSTACWCRRRTPWRQADAVERLPRTSPCAGGWAASAAKRWCWSSTTRTSRGAPPRCTRAWGAQARRLKAVR